MAALVLRRSLVGIGIGLLVLAAVPSGSTMAGHDDGRSAGLALQRQLWDASGEIGQVTELAFAGLLGTPFEFWVDWSTQTLGVRPLPLAFLELPNPDAGCLVTKDGLLNFGWVVDPPGFQDRDECTQRQDHLWPIARSSIVCVIGSGFCDMILEGSAPGPGGDGSGGPFCVNGPGVQVKFWPEVPSSGTMNCSVGLLGSFPNQWETWQGRVRISSQQASGPVLAWGLNWRPEA